MIEFELLSNSVLKPRACGKTELPDRSILDKNHKFWIIFKQSDVRKLNLHFFGIETSNVVDVVVATDLVTLVFQAGVRDSFEENVPIVYFEMKLQNNPEKFKKLTSKNNLL